LNGYPILTKRARKLQKQKADKSPLIFKGLRTEMKPVQAMVFMAFFNQFPYRFTPNNEFYFTLRPGTLDEMGLSRDAQTTMTNNLVGLGFLDKRNRVNGDMEYRIVFDRLKHYIK
jgi:hypothetical protein